MNPHCKIHVTALLDQPFRSFQGFKEPEGIVYRPSSIADRVEIGAGVIIGRGVVLEEGVVVDHQCIVEPNATIGRNTLLIYRAIVGGEAVVGADCVIGGFIPERCMVGSRCRVFGQVVHRQLDTTQSWDEHEEPEPSAIIKDDAFVGFNALVIGGITIGRGSYVCAGAVVTRDVPEGYVAAGVNRFVRVEEWPGRLSRNPGFSSRGR